MKLKKQKSPANKNKVYASKIQFERPTSIQVYIQENVEQKFKERAHSSDS